MLLDAVKRLLKNPSPSDVERVRVRATSYLRLAELKAGALSSDAAICLVPVCISLAGATERCELVDAEAQARAGGVKPTVFARSRATIARIIGVRLQITTPELVASSGVSSDLAAAVDELVEAFAKRERLAASRLCQEALLGGALVAVGAKRRARIDKKRVEHATSVPVATLVAVSQAMREACPALVGLESSRAGTSSGGGRKRRDQLSHHELDAEAADAIPDMHTSGLAARRREYEEWRARVLDQSHKPLKEKQSAAALPEAAGSSDGQRPACDVATGPAPGEKPKLKQTTLSFASAPRAAAASTLT